MSKNSSGAEFDKKIEYGQITFSYSNMSEIEEREIHSYHEILYYMGGDADFTTVKYKHKLKKGSLIIIPAESYHYLNPDESGKFRRLKIGFRQTDELAGLMNEIMDEIRIIENIPSDITALLNKLCSLFETKNYQTASVGAYGAFLLLLTELSESKVPEETKEKNSNPVIAECIKIIDRSMGEIIKISELAKKLNVSESALSHNFRKEIGISLHKYLTQRRLVYAERLIKSGEKPTKIYAECGYRDYSSFYKAYIKLYGCPPSDKT